MSHTPKLLLLGDSIRLSYQPHVKTLLHGSVEVVGPAENCQYSLFTLSSLKRWISDLGQPDIVHWNNVLHDVGHNPGRSPEQIPMDMYRANLEFILKQLRQLPANVIWATITPVHPEQSFPGNEWCWRNDEIDQYNAVARELMEAHDVVVNDLHAVVWRNVEGFLRDDHLHLSEAGRNACAQAVADAVRAHL